MENGARRKKVYGQIVFELETIIWDKEICDEI